MNYRHLYHAGSFADVMKHSILLAVAKKLLQKPAAFAYLDTHSALAYYDLQSTASQKTNEFNNGIAKLVSVVDQEAPAIVNDYLECLFQLNGKLENSDKVLRFYPGSSSIVRYLLREDDRMLLNELHPDDVQTLKAQYGKDQQVSIHQQDAYQVLKALLPFKEKRGLVFIDPAYEKEDEFSQLIAGLQIALQRFATGVYIIWYPLKDLFTVNKFKQTIKTLPIKKALSAELTIYSSDVTQRLFGSGLIIINPPWQIEQELEELLSYLWQKLSIDHQGNWQIDWLVEEESV